MPQKVILDRDTGAATDISGRQKKLANINVGTGTDRQSFLTVLSEGLA